METISAIFTHYKLNQRGAAAKMQLQVLYMVSASPVQRSNQLSYSYTMIYIFIIKLLFNKTYQNVCCDR